MNHAHPAEDDDRIDPLELVVGVIVLLFTLAAVSAFLFVVTP